nr:MAG TPA: hypothetical protein [Bacteriophage sp.]
MSNQKGGHGLDQCQKRVPMRSRDGPSPQLHSNY